MAVFMTRDTTLAVKHSFFRFAGHRLLQLDACKFMLSEQAHRMTYDLRSMSALSLQLKFIR